MPFVAHPPRPSLLSSLAFVTFKLSQWQLPGASGQMVMHVPIIFIPLYALNGMNSVAHLFGLVVQDSF